MTDAYDLLPYTEHAYAESHPGNLSVVARLSGFPLSAPALLTPRVLELGCGRGGNLLPMASHWPEATFVGVDRSESQIRDAMRVAEAAELANVSFVTADFTEVNLPAESFDFVLCHGVYSWVPPEARQTLLARIRGALAKDGVAYVSFNTLPGWYRRLAARDWMRFAARASLGGGPRDALLWLSREVSPEHAAYRADLGRVHDRLLATDAAYLTHEYLAEEHHPVYVSTFMDEAAHAGLAYMGDAVVSEAALELLPDAVRARMTGMSVANAQELADFARDTAFRRALLVRADTAERQGYKSPERLDPRALTGLRIASRLKPSGDGGTSGIESFEGAGATIQASGALRAALRALASRAPHSILCVELAETVGVSVETMAKELFDTWIASPGIDLHTREPAFVSTVSERPRASAVARWHAIEGGPVTNAWHQEVVLKEEIVRFVLGRLDGRATVGDVVRAVREREGERVTEGEAVAVVRGAMGLLCGVGVLVG